MSNLDENVLEMTTLSWFGDLDYAVVYGPDISAGGNRVEREDHGQVLLIERVRTFLDNINRLA